mmetsp:Transcript_27060/g.49241  ORF Transcript_27060/g.49241 Transcript_27060/m.49241 type:complete len:137 (-) Transcript_27060:5532-5942(-)
MTVKDTTAMIAGMSPTLGDGTWVYCFEADPARAAAHAPHAVATIREAEGTTLILPAAIAAANGYDTTLEMRQITLNVLSDLEGIGLTAAVAQALTKAGISCNVVAAYHHDHVFVPTADATRAMDALRAVQDEARRR